MPCDVSTITCSLCIQTRPEYLAMLTAYFDESGHPADSQVVSVAVLVSNENGWHTFSDKWNRILRRYRVNILHMKHYAHSRGEFSDWKGEETKRRRFIGDLASILKNNIRFGYVCSLPMADWNEVMLGKFEDLGEEKRGPLMILLRCCLEAINETNLLPRNQKITCLFECNDFLAGVAPEHFRDWTREWQLDEKFKSFTFAGKYDHPALQGADMLAYEARKYLLDQIVVATGRRPRELHDSLKLSEKINFSAMTRDGLLSYLNTYYPHLLSDEEVQLCSTLPEIEPSLPPS